MSAIRRTVLVSWGAVCFSLVISMAAVVGPALWQYRHPAPAKVEVKTGWPRVWFTRVSLTPTPCAGATDQTVRASCSQTGSSHLFTPEYDVAPNALFSDLAIDFLLAVLVCALTSDYARKTIRRTNTALPARDDIVPSGL